MTWPDDYAFVIAYIKSWPKGFLYLYKNLRKFSNGRLLVAKFLLVENSFSATGFVNDILAVKRSTRVRLVTDMPRAGERFPSGMLKVGHRSSDDA